ncbi:MAG: DUF1476 domain-containing protein [Hyphomicrobiales bacterium]|nr:DUF1476 domain-containing protein [Hyphomicrobiales bacterium]MBV9139233.1 DUF1476 domain-containing protein [Hyphomicrobiales bacterium]MBV9976384.1 DUF1476 domain-containing protein [Hyphomicrobiales bacterium]
MTTFDQREEAFEAKFAHDEELRFLAIARRNKLLGAWAAGLQDLRGDEAKAYALTLIEPEFLGRDDQRLILKIVADLKAKGVERTPQEVAVKSQALLGQAVAEIEAGR